MNVSIDNWCLMPTPLGKFRIYDVGNENVRLVCMGDLHEQGDCPLLRVHSSCLASEVFGSLDCDCADQLQESMKRIAAEGKGLIVHLHQEGRGHGLSEKIRAIRVMQCEGLDTVDAFKKLGLEQDVRSYECVVSLLRSLGIDSVRLITNNPSKGRYLDEHGITVEVVSIPPRIREENAEYLKTKMDKLGHSIALGSQLVGEGVVRFYHSDQTWGELSNFSRHAIYIRGCVWATVEHYYQAQKFAGTLHEEQIRCSRTPLMAKELARELHCVYNRHDWESVKETVMLEGLRAKFAQHPDLRTLLLKSGNCILVEHTEHDVYWGDAADGSGQNRLGHLLMQVRSELSRPRKNLQDLIGG